MDISSLEYIGMRFTCYFYLEFFLAWISLLQDFGFENPAIFALEYTLVPDECYPTQLSQALAGYNYILTIINDPQRICVSGDSAGATIVLSLLLHMSRQFSIDSEKSIMPSMAVLISPWVMLFSLKNKSNQSDYLDVESLHLYARQYLGTKVSVDDPTASPGNCKDLERWTQASPSKGFAFFFGAEEVLAPEIRELVALLRQTAARVDVDEIKSGIHAWPVASLFLSSTRVARLKGLRTITYKIHERFKGDPRPIKTAEIY
ncbi:MAG: hypothetical protein M1818_007001 [Claussenomyces sp. TS43310]|nr:MAG: hypothetical protein M1818_007001 [Claussenomyces sp. TS43310]